MKKDPPSAGLFVYSQPGLVAPRRGARLPLGKFVGNTGSFSQYRLPFHCRHSQRMVPVQLTGMGRSPFPASRSRLGTELSSSGSDTPSPAADTLTGSQREPRAVSDQARRMSPRLVVCYLHWNIRNRCKLLRNEKKNYRRIWSRRTDESDARLLCLAEQPALHFANSCHAYAESEKRLFNKVSFNILRALASASEARLFTSSLWDRK
jgi:hypothetical protein